MSTSSAPSPSPSPIAVDAAGPTPSLLRRPDYLPWLSGALLLDIGDGIMTFALPLITVAVTGSVAAAGLVGIAEGIGMLLGLVPGGLLADRVERRGLRLASGVTGVLGAGVLAAVLATGQGTLPVLCGLSFAMALRSTLLGASSQAMLKQIVPPALLPRAIAVNEGRQAAVGLAAAPVGGALLAAGPVAPVLAQLLGHLGVVVSTLAMRGRYRPRAQEAPATRALEDLRDAARWCLGQPIRLHLMATALLVNLGSNGMMLTVVLVLAVRGVPAVQIGLLETALCAGILLGALASARIVERVPSGVVLLGGILLLTLGAVIVPFLGAVWAIAAVYGVMALGLAPLSAACQGFFLHITPSAMQGRIGALSGVVSLGLMPCAPLIAGFGLAHLGEAVTFGIFALVCAGGAVVVAASRPLRELPVASRWERHARDRGLLAAEDPVPEEAR